MMRTLLRKIITPSHQQIHSNLARLEGFHTQAVYKMARDNVQQQTDDRRWDHPNTADVLGEMGLKTMAHYIEVRCQSIAAYMVDCPIIEM